MKSSEVVVSGKDLTVSDVVAVARNRVRVSLDPSALANAERSRQFVEQAIADGKIIYGITTGFGKFKSVVIPREKTKQLQQNLLRSHAVGVGAPFSEEVVRAAMLVRLNSLMVGYSGVRRELLKTLVHLLNKEIYPFVPEQGSVGASGDLAPLSHLGLVLMGDGEVLVDGVRTPADGALKAKGIAPITFDAKEGLAFTNGTSFITANAALALADAQNLIKVADICLALSLEALEGVEAAFDERIHQLRPYVGQLASAENVRKLTEGSEYIQRIGNDRERVQDAYTLRCAPQVHGAVREHVRFVAGIVRTELNAVTDNPLIFADDKQALSGGNFHGEPIGMAMDVLKIALTELANISERRTARLVDPATNEGLPAFLIPTEVAGLSSGYMITQYTAAALVSEMKVLAHPATVDSIPTSANQEDHVSMGTTASRQALRIAEMVAEVLTIEAITAAQGITLRSERSLGKGTKAAYDAIRAKVPALTEDRILYKDQEAIRPAIAGGALCGSVEDAIGVLK